MFGSSSAGGGITNTGTISGRHTGIAVVGIATFAGAIANISGGRIASKTQAGILVSRVAAFGGGGAGGIFNSGTISAKTGISIADSTITGAIFDFGGSILATSHGIVIGSGSEISAASLTTFTAIGVASAARFLGGIVNSGMLVGLSKGMAVVSISTFTGGIVNGGTITGAQSPGMFIASVSRFSGGIVNSGTISGAGAGIQLESIKTFAGGVSNTGTIAGTIGIDVLNMQGLSIFDAGAIIGSGGTAIELAGSGNTLTLGAGYVISGVVDPLSGSNTFQLGGTGSDTFDLSSIGATAQYQGFTIFNVVGGAWTVTSASSAHWTIRSGGTDEIASGGELTSTTVSSGGALEVDSGATASTTVVKAGGTQIIESGAIISGTTISIGATVELLGGGTALPAGVTIPAGAILALGSGNFSGFTVSSGHTLKVLAGGTDSGAVVRGGGTLIVASGGTDIGATILKGASEKVSSGGTSIDATLKSGGTEVVSAGGIASDTVVSSGGALVVSSGGTADPATIFNGGSETISAHGTDLGAQISGGRLVVLSGGIAVGPAVFSGGTATVSAGGTAIVTTSVGSGGVLQTANGGTAIVSGMVVDSGTLIASGSGSLVEIVSSAVVSGGAVLVGNGIVDVLAGGSANVAFLATGNGGLEIADTHVNSNAFTGTVSGFGGVNHANHAQFIDLVSVTSAAHTISFSYASAGGSGTLTVSSGGAVVASIEFIGSYSSANFHVTAGSGNTVKITDPGVANGGSVQSSAAATFPRLGIDLPDITFGAQTTLAYTESVAGSGGTLTMSDGRHAASIALLGNYMAGSFVAAADGHGGTLVTQAQPQQQPLLTRPQA